MRTPLNLTEAKTVFRQEKAKFTGSLAALAGSRWLMAILATLAIAFAADLLYFPSRLPAIGGISLTTIGLPPLDFGVVGEQASQAQEAGQRQGVNDEIGAFLGRRPELIPLFNWAGLGASLALLLANMWMMTLRRRFTRG